MRMLLFVTFPTEVFNEAMAEGTVGEKLKAILDETEPEAVYFGGLGDGDRGAVVVVDVPTAADLPRITEPWYLAFEAQVEARVAMTPEDIAKTDLDALAAKFG